METGCQTAVQSPTDGSFMFFRRYKIASKIQIDLWVKNILNLNTCDNTFITAFFFIMVFILKDFSYKGIDV